MKPIAIRRRPTARPNPKIPKEQFERLLECMPEKYRGLVRAAVGDRTPLSASGLSDKERLMVLHAFKKAREMAPMPGLIFHDLTRAYIL